MFTDLNTGKTTVLALQGYRKSYCSGNRYAFDAGGDATQ